MKGGVDTDERIDVGRRRRKKGCVVLVLSLSCGCCLVFRPPEPISLYTDGEGIRWGLIVGRGVMPWAQAGPSCKASSLSCCFMSFVVDVQGSQIIQDGLKRPSHLFTSWLFYNEIYEH